MNARVCCSLIAVLLCLSVCLSTTDAKKHVRGKRNARLSPAKPGVCPDDKDMIGACVEKCFGDRECPDDQKCCSNGCGHQCMPPYTEKPGVCPKMNLKDCAQLCSQDGQCPGDQKCCSNKCGHRCVPPYKEKPGVCPKMNPKDCAQSCSLDDDCLNDQKCCSSGCGRQCMSPYKEKPGVCPVSFAGVKGRCAEELCVSDFDCPGNEKCCSSFCGGRMCTPAT
ncbi:perlwapin-like isoform X4 [Carassius auratus]|uniref:Perlwapin-like isoform X4 n=1 Tax=Carassius auratus TaxID=7957 RepID=A0A6P6PHZ8_CARAU|nr:perlwapin-like isoform X4 [Carassius auratus]